MSDRSWGVLRAVVAGAVISLVPMSAAAQSQTQVQTPHTQTTLHFDPIPNARALCPDATKNNFGKTKDRF